MGHLFGCPSYFLGYIWPMFLRKKKNKSGVISIQIIDKSSGKYRVLKTIGSSSDQATIEKLVSEGEIWMQSHLGLLDIFKEEERKKEEKIVIDYLLSNIKNVLINGTELILERVYKSIGFEKINDDILKHLVIARLSQPMSKLATSSYLKDYFDQDIHYQQIYRYMDKLSNSQQEHI